MRRTLLALVLVLPLGPAHAEPPSTPGQGAEKLGYAIGYQVGSDFRDSGRPLDPNALAAGIRDALEGATPKWTVAEMREALRRLEAADAKGRAPDGSRSP